MNIQTISITFCIISATTLSAQSFKWARSIEGTSFKESTSITTDAFGNVYTVGRFEGTADFDPDTGTVNLTSVGSDDVFIQKMDSAGNFLWAKSFGGNSRDLGNSISIDASGNLYTTGFFEGTVDFDPGAGTANLTPVGLRDIYVQKLDTAGNFLWAKSFGGNFRDFGSSICIDASGNVYTLGYFSGTVDFDPGMGITNLTSIGQEDIFIQKMDSVGNFLWARSFGGNSADIGHSIGIDASGNVYNVGHFRGTADFDPGAGTTNHTSTGVQDIYVQKMDSTGNFLWVRTFGGISADIANSISIDASGNLYTTGLFQGTVDFNPDTAIVNLTSAGSEDIFVQKMDSAGNFLWAKSFGGNSTDFGNSISLDTSGNSYTTGYFNGTADFDPGSGTASLTSAGSQDIYVQKMDSAGNFLWAKSFGGNSTDLGSSILVDASGNIYTTGKFDKIANFDPGVGTTNLSSLGQEDIFVQKMSQVTITDVLEERISSWNMVAKAYPNPNTGLIKVSFENPINNVAIMVSDIHGKVLYVKQFDVISDVQIDLDSPSGIYFLNLKSPHGQSVIKLIKK